MIIGLSGKKQHGKNAVAKIIQYLITRKENPGYTFITPFEGFSNLPNFNRSNSSGWEEKAFASKLKEIVTLLIGCTVEQLEDNTFKETPLGEEWKVKILHKGKDFPIIDDENLFPHIPYTYLTPRVLLQLMGTECGRDILHPNIWVNALMADYKLVSFQNATINLGASNEQLEKIGKPVIVEVPNWIITDVRFPNEVKAIKDRGGLVVRINRQWVSKEEALTGKIDNHPSEISLDNYKGFDYVIDNSSTIEDLIHKVEIMLKEFKII